MNERYIFPDAAAEVKILVNECMFEVQKRKINGPTRIRT